MSTVNHRFIHTLRLPSCNLNSTRDVKQIQDAPEKPKATINESRRSTFEACDVTKITGLSVSNINHHFRHTLRLTARSKWKRLKTLLRNIWNERKQATGNELFIQNEFNKKLDRNTRRARETQAKTNV